MPIQATLQQPVTGEKVFLYRIDTTKAGGGVYFFTHATADGKPVYFGGVAYQPVDIQVEGFEVNAGGSLPQPKVRIVNTDKMPQQLVNTYGDLLACQVQRIRTFKQYLDGQPTADPGAYLGPDTFEIERKTSENDEFIEWEMSAAIDQEGKQLPGRVVVRDTCMWRYRFWDKNQGKFTYTRVKCPYAGSACFDRVGNPTTPDKDDCGRRVSDCELRFGKGNPLPFGGFPGSARARG